MKSLNRIGMTETEIKNLIDGYIGNALAGMNKENPKLDFKSKWYDLKQETEINEFIKDSSAIANTPGLDGFIVIGFDDRSRNFNDSVFSDSKLKDSNELTGIIIKRVDRNFDIACYDVKIGGHKITILHIPPSFDKPHVIRNYTSKSGKSEEHRVFVRTGTTTRIATKYDLDFIAYDRKNHIPEYSLFVSTSLASMYPMHTGTKNVDLNIGLIIENNGLRPVAISQIVLTFYYESKSISFVSVTNKEEPYNNNIKVSNIIIQPASIKNCSALVFTKQDGGMTDTEFKEYQALYPSFQSLSVRIKLNNEKIMETKVQLL
jgi:hypothetical protein